MNAFARTRAAAAARAVTFFLALSGLLVAAGAMAYLVKPFQKSDLVPAIEIAASRFVEMTALEAEVATLTDRLETRKLVERAKGALMTTYSMTEPQAFRWIQRTAMDHRMTMRDVAERILAETSTASTDG